MPDSEFPELATALQARCRLIHISTVEEDRAIDLALQVCRQIGRPSQVWDETSELTVPGKECPATQKVAFALDPGRKPPIFPILEALKNQTSDVVIVARRLRTLLDEKIKTSGIKLSSIIRAYFTAPPVAGVTLVIVDADTKLPDDWLDLVHYIELPLPQADDLGRVLDSTVSQLHLPQLHRDDRRDLVQAALGMTLRQAGRAFSIAAVEKQGLNEQAIRRVTEEKKLIIRRNEALEFIPEAETVSPDDVAGLDLLKAWLQQRRLAYEPGAAEFGIDSPKGILLIGIPGTGKSLTAKMIGKMWEQPLLRLDLGALFNQYVGESERRTREALQLAATVSPCILWIDEIEKGVGHSSERDGGATQRTLGTILTWMQERRSNVFVVATANDASRMPPELRRAGRFDAIFRLDPPTFKERMEAFSVHLDRRRHELAWPERKQLADASSGFTGAEIEQVVKDAIFDAFASWPRSPVTVTQLLARIECLKPLVAMRQSQAVTDEVLRNAMPASSPEE